MRTDIFIYSTLRFTKCFTYIKSFDPQQLLEALPLLSVIKELTCSPSHKGNSNPGHLCMVICVRECPSQKQITQFPQYSSKELSGHKKINLKFLIFIFESLSLSFLQNYNCVLNFTAQGIFLEVILDSFDWHFVVCVQKFWEIFLYYF